jgi:hypothetical protein
MRIPLAAALPLLALAALASAPAAAKDDPAKLRDQVLDTAFLEKSRWKAAQALEAIDPEMLGDALLELGEKRKAPANLSFLVEYTVRCEVRHLRLMSVFAAWGSSPEGAAAAYAAKFALEDDKEAARAVEAAGLVAGVQKDREIFETILDVARSGRVWPGIEAARAVNRTMDRRHARIVIEAALATPDNLVRKYLVWTILDFEGSERGAIRVFESLTRRPGKEGENAEECVAILKDKGAVPFAWKPDTLKEVAAWWKAGRPKGPKCEAAVGDKSQKERLEGWIAEMRTDAPGWEHYANSVLHRIVYRTAQSPQIFDLKKKALMLDSGEIVRAESPWQGAYILARDSGIAFAAQLGEPDAGRRAWEPSYFELHSFVKTTKRPAGALVDWVKEVVEKKPWP